MKKRQIVLYATIMFMLLCTSVYATISEGTSSIDSLTAGQEFIVTLYLTGNSSLTSEISSIEGYINIDENVLEDLTVESIVTDSNNQVTINEDNVLTVYDIDKVDESALDGGIIFSSDLATGNGDYKVIIDFNTPITTAVDLFTIKFKVKSGVTPGTYKDAISYELFEMASQSTSSIIQLVDYSIDLTIVSSSSSGSGNNVSNNNVNNNANSNSVNNSSNNINNNNSNNANNNSNNNVANNISNKNLVGSSITNSNSSNNQVDNTVASGSLPLAGYKVFILPLIIASIAGLVFYRKYNQYKQF